MPPSTAHGGISLSFGSTIVFLIYPMSKKAITKETSWILRVVLFGTNYQPSVLDLGLILMSLIPCLYVMLRWEEVAANPGYFDNYHLIFASLLLLGLIEATRRVVGIAIPMVLFFFLLYALFGPYFPWRFGHPGFTLPDILYQLYLMTEGIWGLLTDMAGRIIAPFIIFGPVLFATGVGDTIMQLSSYFGSKLRGGPGHVAGISNAFFGMLSGSSVANAATTGSLAIAKANWLKAALKSMKLGIGGYIMPFYFVIFPIYLMKSLSFEVILAGISAFVAMFAIEAAILGFLTKTSTVLERALYLLGGFLMFVPSYLALLGLGLFLLGMIFERFDLRVPLFGKSAKFRFKNGS